MRHRDRQNIGEKYLQLDSDITIGSLGDNHHYYEKYGHTTKEKIHNGFKFSFSIPP